MTVTQLIIYPIKGMAGISVKSASAKPIGFEMDRRWMLIDEQNKFMTQRTYPNMCKFIPSVVGDEIIVKYGTNVVSFGKESRVGDDIKCEVWDDLATTVEVDYKASEWFSDMLGQRLRLVRLRDESARLHHASTKNIDIPVSLADGYPYLIVGTESLKHLNDKLSGDVGMDRFRPNIVVETTSPHIEDDLTKFSIGKAGFYNVKPCGRCQVITIDQSTATINNEVLKVLNTYRRSGNNVMFGTNVVCDIPGEVCVGDLLV